MKLKTLSKFSIVTILCTSLATFTAIEVNATIAIKPLKQLAQVDPDASGIVASRDQIMVYGNHEKSGFAQLINSQPIDLACGIESFASAATTDSDGNFYIVGAASNPIVGTLPPINGILNPDNVAPDPVSSNKSDANNLCLWKLDPTGKLIESNSLPMNSVIIPNAILVDKYGVTIAGTIYNNPGFSGFMMNWNSPAFILGKSSTQVFSMARTSEGSTVLVGQSSEKLLDKPLKGKSDGFLAKITNGKLSSIQRSSDTKANRAWKSTTSNLILGGFSNSSAVVTKFATNFTPTWTSRYPGIGSAYTATSGRESFAAFVSNGPIKALPMWKRKNAILILTFDSKGLITAANYLNSVEINGFTANGNYGAILLSGGFLYKA